MWKMKIYYEFNFAKLINFNLPDYQLFDWIRANWKDLNGFDFKGFSEFVRNLEGFGFGWI
jgi:hypothetical protein